MTSSGKPMTNLPQEAEDAALAQFLADRPDPPEGESLDVIRQDVREVLEAAAPFIAAQERERLRRELNDRLAVEEMRRNETVGEPWKAAAIARVDTIAATLRWLGSLAPEPVEEPEKRGEVDFTGRSLSVTSPNGGEVPVLGYIVRTNGGVDLMERDGADLTEEERASLSGYRLPPGTTLEDVRRIDAELLASEDIDPEWTDREEVEKLVGSLSRLRAALRERGLDDLGHPLGDDGDA